MNIWLLLVPLAVAQMVVAAAAREVIALIQVLRLQQGQRSQSLLGLAVLGGLGPLAEELMATIPYLAP